MADIKPFIDVEQTSVDKISASFGLTSNGFGQTLTGDFRVGEAVKIEGQIGRILIHNGNEDQILIGFQKGGF
jgi:hypothetical protein